MDEDTQPGGQGNQKQDTRLALIAAARDLVLAGQTPTVADVATRAGISRATAYRHFPSQELLLREAARDALDLDIDGLLAAVSPADDVGARLDTVITAVHQMVSAHETTVRALLRATIDPSPDGASADHGDRRIEWIERALAPVRPAIEASHWDILVAALALCVGVENRIVLVDRCGQTADEALATARWTARTLLQAALITSPESAAPPKKGKGKKKSGKSKKNRD
jgi:AcrR family transcriptional regulator